MVLSGSTDKYSALIAAPVLTEGDVMGCVIFFGEEDKATTETEYKLAQTVAGFLGKTDGETEKSGICHYGIFRFLIFLYRCGSFL